MTVRHPEFCFIDGRRYRVGDVVLDLRGGAAPQVRVHDAEPDAWRWFVVRVNPNCDERAERSLGSKGIRTFRPVERVLTETKMVTNDLLGRETQPLRDGNIVVNSRLQDFEIHKIRGTSVLEVMSLWNWHISNIN